ncbi:MAG TPA: tetratricopeptide repeat protein [Deferrimonas sp.]|jgi:lipopolysaccharide biosynthesis regulator YciM
MTLMSLLLLVILFLVFFIYFSGLNPQDITIHYLPDHEVTYSVAIVVVVCVLAGLIFGYGAHVYSVLSHLARHWKHDRQEKKAREVAAIYREGVGRLLSGDIKKAHALLQKALDRDPSRVETYIALANVRLQEGEAQEGVNLLLKAKNLEPKSLEVLFKLASAYEEGRQDEEALQTYQAILAIESSNRKALRSLRDLHLRNERWQQALEMQKRVLKVGPGSNRIEEEKQMLLSLRYEVARISLSEGKTDEARAVFQEISQQAPEFTPARVSLGDALAADNRQEEAARVWQDGYKSLGKSIFLSRLEDLYMDAEDPASLLTFYRNALLEKGDDLMLRLFFGKFCLRLEMVDEALEQLETVESSGIEFPQLHLLLAEAHRRRRRTEEAIKEYKKALGVNNRLPLGYVCESCGERLAEWQSRCQECGTWGSYSLADRHTIRNARPLEVREIHHGQREAWNEE